MKNEQDNISSANTAFSFQALKRFIFSDILKSDIKKFNLLKDTFTSYERTMTPNDILKLLKKTSTNVFFMKDENNATLLHIALKNCTKRIILTNELLIEIAKRTPVSEMSHKDNDGVLPIHLVAGMNRQFLSIPIGDSPESKELMEYIISNTPEELRISTDLSLRTPLHIYVERGNTTNLDLFLSISPAKLYEMQNDSGQTILHTSLCRCFGENILSIIIKKTSQLVFSIKDNFGSIPLHLAAVHGNAWIVNLVLSYTRDEYLVSKNIEAKIPLDYALKKGSYTEELLIRTPDKSLREIDKEGNNMLHKACYFKRFNIIDSIIDRLSPEDLMVQNKQKLISLHIALANMEFILTEISDYSNWNASYVIHSIEKLIKKIPNDVFFLTDSNGNTPSKIVKDFLCSKRHIIEGQITREAANKAKNPDVIKELNSEWLTINKRIYKLCSLHKNVVLEKRKISEKLLQISEPTIIHDKASKEMVLSI